MTTLLDANVLIALAIEDHVHHDAAEAWFASSRTRFATCPSTQGALVRLVVRQGGAAQTAVELLRGFVLHRRHEFWPDDISYVDVALRGVVGHRQVTDAYLAQLSRQHGAKLATFDAGLAGLHADVAELVTVG